MIQAFNRSFFKDFPQKHVAKGGRQLVNKPCNPQIVIAYNGFFRIKYFPHFQSNLGFFERAGQILYAYDGSANADNDFRIKFAA